MLIKINKKFALIFVLLNCARHQFSDIETIELFKHLAKHGQFAEDCEDLVEKVAMPQDLLDFLEQARIKYDREMFTFLQNPNVRGLPKKLSKLIARAQIDDDKAVGSIMQKIINLGECNLVLVGEQKKIFDERISRVMIAYLPLVRHWESQGYFKRKLLTDPGTDFIGRIQEAEDKFTVLEEMMDSWAQFEQESESINVIPSFGKYLENQLAYVLDVCIGNGINLEVNKYDFILFLQMQGLPLVKELREADDKPKAIAEILDAYEARKFSIEQIKFYKWDEIHMGLQTCKDENGLAVLEQVDPELPSYPKAFYQAMLDPVNLTLWVGFNAVKMIAGESILNVRTVFESSPEGIDLEIEAFPRETQDRFAYLDAQLIQFLERYAQDTNKDIPPLNAEKYNRIYSLNLALERLKPHNPGSNKNIDRVLDLIENETAKVGNNV